MKTTQRICSCLLLFLLGCGNGDNGTEDTSSDVLAPPSYVEAQTESGTVRGEAIKGLHVFKGIPYAAPPVGAQRWRPPVVHAGWEGVLDTLGYGEPCPQLKGGKGEYIGEEDCLTLSVWAPSDSADLRPVLVQIYGGGHIFGSTDQVTVGDVRVYDGTVLVEHGDVVVVTINYRLGALGYLAHPDFSAESDEGVSGNYGTLDQIRALQWVQDNIQAFGGDPNQITIAGQSSGATDVCVLMTSALSEGLFHGAIMQSGSCGVRNLIQGELSGESMVAETSCADADSLLECLRAMPAEEVIEELAGFIDFTSLNSGLPEGHMYMPYVDGWVLEKSPFDQIEAGEHHPVPVLLGSTSHETAQAIEFTVASAAAFELFLTMTYGEETGQALLDAYPPSEYESAQEALLFLSSDMRFTNEARRAARVLTDHQEPAVYRYYFTHWTTTPDGLLAPAHTYDLLYTFGLLEVMSGMFTLEESDALLLEETIGLWTRFIAKGDPNLEGETAWTVYDSTLDNSFVLDVNAHMENGIQGEQCDLWESIFQY